MADTGDTDEAAETNGSGRQSPLPAATAADNNERRHRTAVFVHGPVLTVRDRVFHALFFRLALIYARAVPHQLRRVIEFALLFEALLSLALMTYVHCAFTRHPVNCLQFLTTEPRQRWIREGIVRVEVIRNAPVNYSLIDSYHKEFVSYKGDLFDDSVSAVPANSHESGESGNQLNETSESDVGATDDRMTSAGSEHVTNIVFADVIHNTSVKSNVSFLTSFLRHFSLLLDSIESLLDTDIGDNDVPLVNDVHIFEFAAEFGFLRMSPKTRHRLNITTKLIVLDPGRDECFGGALSQFLLDELLGYEDIILYSLKQLSDDKPHRGYCRSVATGDHYKFVDMSVSRLCYLPALLLMILFTMSISMLLRYSHHQIFVFIVDFLQVFDRTIFVLFPLAPLMTALLALIGVEALISELFSEASTGFYVILIVWLADQYDVICCHTALARRHWLRFFYLYHFLFYAYHYRFNGHYSGLALATSWLFIQHSMVYFFHHYELPAVEQQAHVHNLIALAQRQQTPQHLLTVMTRTANGDLARTTADISQLRPVTVDHSHAAQPLHVHSPTTHSYQLTNSYTTVSATQATRHEDNSMLSTPHTSPVVDNPAETPCDVHNQPVAHISPAVANLTASEAQSTHDVQNPTQISCDNLPVSAADIQCDVENNVSASYISRDEGNLQGSLAQTTHDVNNPALSIPQSSPNLNIPSVSIPDVHNPSTSVAETTHDVHNSSVPDSSSSVDSPAVNEPGCKAEMICDFSDGLAVDAHLSDLQQCATHTTEFLDSDLTEPSYSRILQPVTNNSVIDSYDLVLDSSRDPVLESSRNSVVELSCDCTVSEASEAPTLCR